MRVFTVHLHDIENWVLTRQKIGPDMITFVENSPIKTGPKIFENVLEKWSN